MPFVKTVSYNEADGETKAAYDWILQTRGAISNATAVSSLRPGIMQTLAAHSVSVLQSESGLTPAERQMIATVVSAINKCQY